MTLPTIKHRYAVGDLLATADIDNPDTIILGWIIKTFYNSKNLPAYVVVWSDEYGTHHTMAERIVELYVERYKRYRKSYENREK